MNAQPNQYLGAGVYVENIASGVLLTVQDGYTTPKSIFLSPLVLAKFIAHVAATKTETEESP